jgi:hypothetical protein
VERGVVDDAYGLARGFVAEGEEVREVILTEGGVVVEEAADASVAVGGRFVGEGASSLGDSLNLRAVFAP